MKIGCQFESLYVEKTHYPILDLVVNVLLYIFDAKKGFKKKSLNKLSLAADLLNTNKLLETFYKLFHGQKGLISNLSRYLFYAFEHRDEGIKALTD